MAADPPDPTSGLILRYYAVLAACDVLGLLDVFVEDGSIDVIGDPLLLPYCGVWRGQDGLAAMLLAIATAYETLAVEPVEIIEIGPGRLVARGTAHIRFRVSGREVWTRWIDLLHVAGGRIVAVMAWRDTAAHYTALHGLSPPAAD